MRIEFFVIKKTGLLDYGSVKKVTTHLPFHKKWEFIGTGADEETILSSVILTRNHLGLKNFFEEHLCWTPIVSNDPLWTKEFSAILIDRQKMKQTRTWTRIPSKTYDPEIRLNIGTTPAKLKI